MNKINQELLHLKMVVLLLFGKVKIKMVMIMEFMHKSLTQI